MKNTKLVILFLLINVQVFAQSFKIDSIQIYYKINAFELTTNHINKLNNYIEKLDTTKSYQIKIISSADYLGSIKSNHVLAGKRNDKIKELINVNYPNRFEIIETQNKGEISLQKTQQYDKEKGDLKSRKTSVVFIEKLPSKAIRKKAIKKKVYIYNPDKTQFDLEVGKKFILKRLVFYRGTTTMQKRSKNSLKGLLRFLEENPKVEVEIQGHLCCNAGIYQPDKTKVKPLDKDNLSTRRARLIYKYLVKQGIRKSRLTYNGYGFQTPIHYPESSEKDKSINKRVEIVITKY